MNEYVCLSVSLVLPVTPVIKHTALYADPTYRLLCDRLDCKRIGYVEGLLF
jgi:hypothetical protein